MKKHLPASLTLLLAMLLLGSLSAQKKIMFITTSDTGHLTAENVNSADSIAAAKMRAAGFTVIGITDGQSNTGDAAVAAAVAEADGIVCSSTVKSGWVGGNSSIMDSDLPWVVWETLLWDDLLITSDDASGAFSDSSLSVVSGTSTDIVGPHTGLIQVVTGMEDWNVSPVDSIAGTATLKGLFDYTGEDRVGAWVVEKGDKLIDGSDAKRLMIGWWFKNSTQPAVTDLGWDLFVRHVSYSVGQVFVGISSTDFGSKSLSWFGNGYLNLDLSGYTGMTDIRVYDISGKRVLQRKVSGGDQVSVPMHEFANGVYIVMGENFAEKFVKQ